MALSRFSRQEEQVMELLKDTGKEITSLSNDIEKGENKHSYVERLTKINEAINDIERHVEAGIATRTIYHIGNESDSITQQIKELKESINNLANKIPDHIADRGHGNQVLGRGKE